MPDIKYGSSIRVGNTGGTKPQKQRAPRSNILPPEHLPETDPVVSNLESLVDIQFRPMFQEILERGRGDYGAFASDFLNVELHDGQKRWLHGYPWCAERMLSCGNRWGKTYSEAVKALHDTFFQTRYPKYAYLTNRYIFVNLSLTVDMARIAWDTALNLGKNSKMFSRFIMDNEVKTAPFPIMVIGSPKSYRGVDAFRSEFWARSSSKGARYLLGKDIDRISFDECARDPNGATILDEVLRMRVADRDGQIDMPSTAAGKNYFYLQCQRANQDPDHVQYYFQTGSSLENPHISHARVKANEKVMTAQWVAQNIYGGFADYANVFDRVLIEDCYRDVESLDDKGRPVMCNDYVQLPTFPYDEDAQYLMAIDWALKRDETVIMVAKVNVTPSPIVYCQGFSFKPGGGRYSWQELKNIAVMVHKRFGSARCVFDATGMAGAMIADDLTNLGMTNHEGYDFAGNQGQAKDHLILVTQQALQNHAFKFPFSPFTSPFVDQMLLYDRADRNLSTDYVFAFALLAENLRRANLPISEALDAPFVYASRAYQYGYQVPSRDNYRILGAPEPEAVVDDPFTSENPETTRVLTSAGYREVAEEELVA